MWRFNIPPVCLSIIASGLPASPVAAAAQGTVDVLERPRMGLTDQTSLHQADDVACTVHPAVLFSTSLTITADAEQHTYPTFYNRLQPRSG